MKFSASVFVLLSMFFSANAAFYSHVTIYNEDHLKFTVYLNGEKKNDEPKENVRLINLTQSYYKLKIEFEDATIPPIEKKIFQLTDANGSPVDATHIIKKNKKGEYGIHWQSQTTFPGYIDNDKPTVVIVNGGTANTVVRETTTQTSATPTSGVRMNFGVPGGSVSINTGNAAPAETTTTTTTTYAASAPAATSAKADNCTGTMLGTEDFSSALSSIKARSTAEGKLTSAKQIISSNCFTVDQVKQLVKVFADDESKLEVAKSAFAHTLDKGNYFKLNTEFKDEKYIDELSKATTR